MRNKNLLLSWPFLAGLVLLVLNDHYLKNTFPNFITGKLSDFAGIFIFPLFLAFVFPRYAERGVLFTAFFFIFWKLPIADPFIEFYNRLAIIPISRVVDYTDYIALIVLPLSKYVIKHPQPFEIRRLQLIPSWLILLPACFIFMATSPPRSYYFRPHGDVWIGTKCVFHQKPEQVLKTIKEMGFVAIPDTTVNESFYRAYVIENPVFSKGDTLDAIHFQLLETNQKTILYLNSVNTHNIPGLDRWKLLKYYSKYYNRLIRKKILDPIE